MQFKQPSGNQWVVTLAVWQGFSVLMIGVFNWPFWLVWLNLVLFFVFMLFLETHESILLVILSSPFFVILPNAYFDTLSIWRPLLAWLFLVWLQRLAAQGKIQGESLGQKLKQIEFSPWDKFLLGFVVYGLLSLFWARAPLAGLKLILFWLNIYLFYVVVRNTVNTRAKLVEIIKYAVYALTVLITLGFIQLFSTFFLGLDTFWVYWASYISKLYYGLDFAQISLYSNSWFSFNGARELRMFSIMPDSQSFAYMCIFGVGFGLALTLTLTGRVKNMLWSGIRFASLAVILSGTRAAWVGFLMPAFAAVYAFYRKFWPDFSKKFIFAALIMFILFGISPLINLGLQKLRFTKFEERFLDRARSIYDLREVSNLGRLKIWENSLEFFKGHPQGTGLGNFQQALSKDAEQRYNLPKKHITAHNLYLHLLVELGALGLLIFCGFIFKLFKEIFIFLKLTRSGSGVAAGFIFFAGLAFLWIFAAAFFDLTLFNDKVLIYFFLSLGLIGAIIKNYKNFLE